MDENKQVKKQRKTALFKQNPDQELIDYSVNTFEQIQKYFQEKYNSLEIEYIREIQLGLVYQSKQSIFIVKQIDKSQLYCSYLINKDKQEIEDILDKENIHLQNLASYYFDISSNDHLKVDREFHIFEINEQIDAVLNVLKNQPTDIRTTIYDAVRNTWNNLNKEVIDQEKQDSLLQFHNQFDKFEQSRELFNLTNTFVFQVKFKSVQLAQAFGVGFLLINNLENLVFNVDNEMVPFIQKIKPMSQLRSLKIINQQNYYSYWKASFSYQEAFELIGNQQKLIELTLNITYSGLNQELKLLSEQLDKLDQIQKITFGFQNSKVYDNGIEDLSRVLSTKKQLKELKLNLLENQISYEGQLQIINILKDLQELMVLSIQLPFEQSLFQYLFDHLVKLNQLVELQLIIQMGVEQIDRFANELKSLTNLKNLQLTIQTVENTDEEIVQFGKQLAYFTNLTHLSLNFNEKNTQMRVEGIRSVMTSILQLSNLIYLYLNLYGYRSQNKIGNSGAMIIANTIKKMKNIRFFDLNKNMNDISASCEREINASIHHMHRLITYINR